MTVLFCFDQGTPAHTEKETLSAFMLIIVVSLQ